MYFIQTADVRERGREIENGKENKKNRKKTY